MPIKLHNYRIRLFLPSCWVGLFLLVFLLGTSCKTYQRVDWINPKIEKGQRNEYFEARQLSRLREGDKLYILTKDSLSFDIIYYEVKNDSIQGLFTQKNNKRIKAPIETGIPNSRIQMIKVKKFSSLTTLGVVVAVPVVVWSFLLTTPIL